MLEFDIRDSGGIEVLTLACEATDRIQSLTEAINRDGVTYTVRGAPRSHPSLRDELGNRAFVSKCLEKLGVNVEAVRSVGRPGGRLTGWSDTVR